MKINPGASGAVAGYSGTPLVKKLGITPGFRVAFRNPPGNLSRLLVGLPDDLTHPQRGELDLALLFVTTFSELKRGFTPLMKRLSAAGAVWVSWPKKSSGKKTDLSENLIRDFGLAEGLVDVKVCAIDETWSGLKFVRRLKDR